MQSLPFGVFVMQTHWPAEHPIPLFAQLEPQFPQLLASD